MRAEIKPQARSESRTSALAALRNPKFTSFLLGVVISRIGDSLQSVTQVWLVFQMTGSSLSIGVVGSLQLAPRVVMSAIGGVIADRLSKRNFLIAIQVFGLLQSLAFFLLLITHRLTTPLIMVLALVLGLTEGMGLVSRNALVPDLVEPRDLQPSLSMTATGIITAQAVGPGVAGIVLAKAGAVACVLGNILSFVIVILVLLRLPGSTGHAVRSHHSLSRDLLDGFTYLIRRPALSVVVATAYAVAIFVLGFDRVLPQISASLGEAGAAARYGALAAAFPVGSVIASLGLVAVSRPQAMKDRTVPLLLLMLAGFGMFSLSSTPVLLFLSLGLAGAGYTGFRVLSLNALLSQVDERYRGRAVSILQMDYGLMAVGMVWLGWLSDRIGPQPALAVGVALGLAFVLITRPKLAAFASPEGRPDQD